MDKAGTQWPQDSGGAVVGLSAQYASLWFGKLLLLLLAISSFASALGTANFTTRIAVRVGPRRLPPARLRPHASALQEPGRRDRRARRSITASSSSRGLAWQGQDDERRRHVLQLAAAGRRDRASCPSTRSSASPAFVFARRTGGNVSTGYLAPLLAVVVVGVAEVTEFYGQTGHLQVGAVRDARAGWRSAIVVRLATRGQRAPTSSASAEAAQPELTPTPAVTRRAEDPRAPDRRRAGARGVRRDLRRRRPGDGAAVRDARARRRGGRRPRGARGARRRSRPGRSVDPFERGRVLQRLGELVEAHADELARARGARRRQAASRGAARHRRSPSARGSYYAGWPTKITGTTNPADPGRLLVHAARAARRRRRDHAVELPAPDRVVEARAGARVRERRRAQAGRGGAALGAPARGARARGGRAGRGLERRHGRGRGGRRARRARRRRQGLVHRLDRGRPRDPGAPPRAT